MKRVNVLLTCLIFFLIALSTSCDLSKPIYPTATNSTSQPISEDFNCQASIFPWEISWLPSDHEIVTQRIDSILSTTGLSEHGNTILQSSLDYQVNPTFALAMFRKEATFAAPGTRANKNKNPGNIIATGGCRGKPAGSECTGLYGETSTDGRFGVYPDMSAGINAYYQLLHQEYGPGSKRNCADVSCIIQSYCPPSDCDTQNYIDQITEWSKEYQCQLYTEDTLPSLSPTITPTIVVAPIITPTEKGIPKSNIWILPFPVPNYELSFNPQKWEVIDFINFENNEFPELVFISDNNCKIVVPGNMGMPEDYTTENIGVITYDIVNRLNVDEPYMAYMAKNEIDSETQSHPFFFVFVPKLKPENCISEAEQVLSTLSNK